MEVANGNEKWTGNCGLSAVFVQECGWCGKAGAKLNFGRPTVRSETIRLVCAD